jgi:hypothetical protein
MNVTKKMGLAGIGLLHVGVITLEFLPQRVFFHQDSQDALQMVLEVNHDHINCGYTSGWASSALQNLISSRLQA